MNLQRYGTNSRCVLLPVAYIEQGQAWCCQHDRYTRGHCAVNSSQLAPQQVSSMRLPTAAASFP